MQEEAEVTCWISETMASHMVNFVVAENVFTGEIREFQFGQDMEPIAAFVSFATTFNMGNNIMVAHNSSGYDSKLLLHHVHHNFKKEEISLLPTGQKILKLEIGARTCVRKTRFFDSMLHLPGSLAGLAGSFCPGVLKKGYFPHKFNLPQNYGYVGPVPPKEEFDIMFSAKSYEDVEKFNEWWQKAWDDEVVWDFKEQMSLYCRNDVHVLAIIMKMFNDAMMDKFGMSPWFNSTGPSFAHEVSLIKTWQATVEDEGLEDLKKDYPASYNDKLQELAYNKHWVIQKPLEYNFTRMALRGGRTENKQMLVEISDEEIANGVHMRYWDVCSMYPYQQLSLKDFPGGVGVLVIYDEKFDACRHKDCRYNPNRKECDHVGTRGDRDLLIEYKLNEQPTVDEILADDDFFGIVCATVVPVKMLHPVLPVFDEKRNKCLFTCERIVKGVFDTPSFKYALKCGYKLEKVWRLDRYHRVKSLWRPLQMDLYCLKMLNSGDEPENFEKFCEEYGEKFGEEFADVIRSTAGKWGYKTALRQVYKILNNCGWGKHAQRPTMNKTEVFSDHDLTKYKDLVKNIHSGAKDYKSSIHFDNHVQMTYHDNEVWMRPNLERFYLPAGVFVPAYGRLQLCMELHKLEKTQVNGRKRVVMMDTDSIIAIYYPEDKYPGVYNIPEGTKVGDWEREGDDSKHGGIRKYVGLGPKTYCYQGVDGVKSKPKSKGVRLGYSTGNIVNFDAYEDIVKKFLLDKKSTYVHVPQTSFGSDWKNGVRTDRFFKKMGVNVAELKGVCDENGYVWPFGYDEADDGVERDYVMTDETLNV